MENLEIPGRIQRERFTLVDFFRKKSNAFRGITFFPLSPKRPKFSVPFVGITSARRQVERKRKIYRYFVNGTIQARSRFRFQKKYQYLQNGKCHLSENGPRIFLIGLVPGVCVCSPAEGLLYEKGGDARRLAYGCKFPILVSFRVFWAKRHYI